MAQIESHSEKVSHRTVNFFKPSWAEVSLYLLLSLIILLVLNLGKFIQTLGGNYIGSPNQVKASFSNLFSGFNNSFSTALGGRLGQIILWAFIGAMAYIGLWLAKNVLNSFENDIISDHYLHPSSYNRAGYWGSSLAGKIFLGVLLLIVVSYIFMAVRVILPALALMAGSAAYHFDWHSSLTYMLFTVLGTSLIIYVGVVLLRLLSHLWKLL